MIRSGFFVWKVVALAGLGLEGLGHGLDYMG